MVIRILFSIVILLGAFLVPWWFSLILVVAGLFYFDNLYESVLVGMIIDSLYGSSMFFNLPYPATLFVLVLILATRRLKSNLISY